MNLTKKMSQAERRGVDAAIAMARADLDNPKATETQRRYAEASLDECERRIAQFHAA